VQEVAGRKKRRQFRRKETLAQGSYYGFYYSFYYNIHYSYFNSKGLHVGWG
jgi:hypothetical protein